MNRANIKEWIAHPNHVMNRMTLWDFKALCELALRNLNANEPTNREKIYGPLLDKSKPKADEPVAWVWDEAAYPDGDVRGRGWREVMGRQHPNNPAMTRHVNALYLSDVLSRCAEPTNREKIYGPLLNKIAGELDKIAGEADVWLAVESHELELAALRSKVAELDAANAGLAQESHDLQQICRDAYEVWAGSEGIPVPQTFVEEYLLQLLEQMRDKIKRGLK